MWLWDSIAALTEGPPKGSVFACSHLYWVESFSLPKVLYFRRTPELDELWEATVVEKEVLGDFSKLKDPETHACHPYERRVAAPCRGAEAEACRNLLAAMFSAKSRFSGPTEHFICGGLVDESCYATIVTEYRDRREQNHRLAMEVFRKSEIIVAARALGLDPKPGCEESAMWTAGCPGRSPIWRSMPCTTSFIAGTASARAGFRSSSIFAPNGASRTAIREGTRPPQSPGNDRRPADGPSRGSPRRGWRCRGSRGCDRP